jgi:hypothetical protein
VPWFDKFVLDLSCSTCSNRQNNNHTSNIRLSLPTLCLRLLLLLLLLLLQICAVFAQLTVGGVWQGPHVFMVRIRDDKGNVTPGGLASPLVR